MSTDLSTSSSPGGGGGGMATGDIGYGHDPNLNVTVSSRLSPQDRAALATLQREPAPEAYRDRVQQYFKNLATGSAPGSITR